MGLVREDPALFPLLDQSATESCESLKPWSGLQQQEVLSPLKILKEILLTKSPFFGAKCFLHFLPNLNLFSQRKSPASLNSVCAREEV